MVVADAGSRQPSAEHVALQVWLDKVAEVVAAILTRRRQSRDHGDQGDEEGHHENS